MKPTVYATSKPGHTHVMRSRLPDVTAPRGFRQHDKSFDNAREMFRAIEAMQARIDSGEFDAQPYTFGEAAYHWLETRDLKPVTRDARARLIKYVLTSYLDMPLQEVAMMRRELQELIHSHPAGKYLRAIVEGACDLAQAEGSLTIVHRLGMMTLKREPKHVRELIPITAEQLNTMVASVPDRMKLLILLMRACGLRVGEALAMETDAIHDGWLEVRRGTSGGYDGTPKQRYEGFTPRKVPIPDWLVPELEKHIQTFARDGVFFPPGRAGKSRYLSYLGFRYYFMPAVKAAGLPADSETHRLNFTPHQFRKHWATQLRAESRNLGISFEDIEEWIGHANLTRDVYGFQGDDVLARGRKLSDPRDTSDSVR